MDENCTTCQHVKEKCGTQSIFKTFVLLHTDIATIKGNKTLESKKIFRGKFEKCVAALRNTEGGILLIHIHGQESWDRNLEDFDQCFGKCIEEQIEGGQLFINTCKRYWLSDLSEFKEFRNCLLIEVTKTDGVVTVDFNTKLRSDFENTRPSCINIISLLHFQSEPSGPTLILKTSPKEGKTIPIEESRHVELKSIKPEIKEYKEVKSNLKELINYIWTKLKLKVNISSLSKVQGGGSFIVGLTQVAFSQDGYKTKQTKVVGFELHVDKDKFVNALKNKFTTDLCVLSGNNFEDFDQDKVNIQLAIVQENPHKYILEVAIAHVCGVVFYDKQGPRTYLLNNDVTERMTKEEWLHRLRSIRIPERPIQVDVETNTSKA